MHGIFDQHDISSPLKDSTGILRRHPANPLIQAKDHPGISSLFNPAPALYNGKVILLVSVLPFTTARFGETRVAESEDGIHFTLRDEAFVNIHREEFPYNVVCEHVIDNRVTKIDDWYYLITPVQADKGRFLSPAGVLGRTKDFESYEPIEIITQPLNRGASLFPQKINGKYFKLDRPGAGDGSAGSIWLSSSPDLIHWGCFRPVLAPGYSFWNRCKIGPTPPIWTPEGWLVIVHGVFNPAGGIYYYIGAILLDLEEPWKVIGKTKSWLLAPEERYETNGMCDNVVFPCGALADLDTDELLLYYGAADSSICLATGKVSDVLHCCKNEI